jgi:hypothetical protein
MGEDARQRKPVLIDLETPSLRVGDVIKMVFPKGTLLDVDVVLDATADVDDPIEEYDELRFSLLNKRRRSSLTRSQLWGSPPELPPDAFAVAGLLLDWSGAAHHVVVEPSPYPEWKRTIVVSSDERNLAKGCADEWRKSFKVDAGWRHPDPVSNAWSALISAWREPVFRQLRREDSAPDWWAAALRLFMIADEASASFGFYHRADVCLLDQIFDDLLAADGEAETGESGALQDVKRRRYTISSACPDVVCVLPKSRTASVGCTLRSLSHNLALLPPRGLARANWHSFDPDAFQKVEDDQPLNILLVPYPYDLPSRCFEGETTGLDVELGDSNWFEIHPEWKNAGDGSRARIGFDGSPEAFVAFIEDLLIRSGASVRKVGAIVFPECSMSYDYFRALAKRAQRAVTPGDAFYWIEFIIAGTTTDQYARKGNHAASCFLARPQDKPERKMTIGVQDKHHRWRIDRTQSRDYGVGGSLPGGRYWWERLELRSRALNVFNFRESSTFVALICEDLARLEPVHQIVRAIGPNIVFALLLDGPQVSARWPGRYAVGLSDDPGSSVLTLSCYGLISRYNERALETYRSTSVGLWRDEGGATRPINLEKGSAACLLSLSAERKCEISLDGRSDNSQSVRWVFADLIQIAAT